MGNSPLQTFASFLLDSAQQDLSMTYPCWPRDSSLLLTRKYSPGPEEVLLKVDRRKLLTVCQVYPLTLATSLVISVTPLQ